MLSQALLAELERRFDHGDAHGAYALWLIHGDDRLELGLSADERRRLRGTLHIVLQMAAELGWEREAAMKPASGQRIV